MIDERSEQRRVNCCREEKISNDRIILNAQMIEQLRFVCHDNIETPVVSDDDRWSVSSLSAAKMLLEEQIRRRRDTYTGVD
jgi:hypothetical protein